MKYLLLFSILFFFEFTYSIDKPIYFEYRLSNIVQQFKSGIMNPDDYERSNRDIEDLTQDIEKALKIEDEYTYDEINQLKVLKKEVKAVESYIGAVGGKSDYISIEELNKANLRIGGSIFYVIKDKYCVDVIKVVIGNFVAYLCENNSEKIYNVSYKWNSPKPNNWYRGSGTMGMPKFCLRPIYDNRLKPTKKIIYVYDITCKDFEIYESKIHL